MRVPAAPLPPAFTHLAELPLRVRDIVWTPLGQRFASNFEDLSPAISDDQGEVTMVHSLALTPNGKVDRKALPAPEGDAYTHRTYEAPQGEMEIALVGIWQELLQIR